MLVAAIIVFSQLEDLFKHVLYWLHNSGHLSWAWSIVALTVIVRVLIVPLTVKQIHSMQSLQAHAPEMKEIQKRYRHDKQRQQQELMRFYKENNINPMASCLPMLAQFPVFIALYYVLRHFAKHPPCNLPTPAGMKKGAACVARGDFSWLGHSFFPNIAQTITTHWTGYLLLVIYVGSQLAATYFMSGSAQKSQRILMMALPVLLRLHHPQVPDRARSLLGDDEPLDGRTGPDHADADPEARGAGEALLAHAGGGGEAAGDSETAARAASASQAQEEQAPLMGELRAEVEGADVAEARASGSAGDPAAGALGRGRRRHAAGRRGGRAWPARYRNEASASGRVRGCGRSPRVRTRASLQLRCATTPIELSGRSGQSLTSS